MSKLLYIESSPRKKRSHSIQVAHTFLEEYKKTHSGDTVEMLDLWSKPLPPFDGDVIASKYAIMQSTALTEAERKQWKNVEDIIHEFKSADKYLISVPMWNFGVPYQLKHYIDLIVQPGYTFSQSAEGFKGIVVNKPMVIIYARGGAYPVGTPADALDFQKRYLETIFGFIGFKDFKSIVIEPTGSNDKEVDKRANEIAVSIASQF